MAQTQLETRKIAMRYAKALLEAAQEQGQLDTIKDNILLLQRLYLEVPELNRFFSNPAIPENEKLKLIHQRFKKGLSPMMSNLLGILMDNRRIEVLPDIINTAIELIKQREGIVQADITVPVSLNESLENQMRSTLERFFGYQQVELNIKVDPAILAGAIVKIGDKIIDGSYHGKLETLRRQVG